MLQRLTLHTQQIIKTTNLYVLYYTDYVLYYTDYVLYYT